MSTSSKKIMFAVTFKDSFGEYVIPVLANNIVGAAMRAAQKAGGAEILKIVQKTGM